MKYERKCVSFTTRIYRLLHSMTPVIDKKAERIENKSAFDQKNFMFKFIKTRHFLKAEQNICYFISKEDSEYIHEKLKKPYETSDVYESLKKLKDTNKIHEFYKEEKKMNDIQNLECNEHH